MDSERVIIIGDIHGCLDMLKRLMDKIAWEPSKDRLIFLGDYIDRGENPKGVVDYILALRRCSDQVECLMGNHETLFLNYLNGKDRELFLLNQGWSTLESYEADKSEEEESLVPSDHLVFYQTLKSYIQLEEYYVVHAGFRPGVEIKSQSLNDLTWIRDSFIYSDYNFGKKVIFGHTPFREPLIIDNKIGLDTGAVFGNKLTCLELPEFKFHSVEPRPHLGL
jgi:serine/threonine protein phosphatase 1